MARAKTPTTAVTGSLLAHPVYLDTPMLVSFLASLEDGVSYTSEVAERVAAGREGEGEGTGKVALPSIATLLGLNLSAEGRYKRRNTSEDSVENKFIREHTAASLFNRLMNRLRATDGMLTELSVSTQLEELADGSLIEMHGQILGNPLRQVLEFFAALGPYIGLDIEDHPDEPPEAEHRPTGGSRKRSGAKPPAKLPQLTNTSGGQTPELSNQDILRVVKREVSISPVVDLLMESREGLRAVLTVNRELLSPEVEAYFVGGRFTVLAKVSAVLTEGNSISLLRRTAFGTMGRSVAEEMFSAFTDSSEGLDFSVAETVIDGPAVQLLPLAIYLQERQNG
jgi:hypothetical protein